MASFTVNSKLIITSSAFTNNGIIPSKYSCEGEEINPPLQISNIPSEAKSLAVIVHDPDAPKSGGMTHWVVWNIDISGAIPENYKQGEQGLNGKNEKGYIGMCPPSGTHRYFFRAYALDRKLDLGAKTNEDGLKKAMRGHIIAEGELMGLYSKK